MILGWLSTVRGSSWRIVLHLVLGGVVVLVAANVSVQLRTPADRAVVGLILDNGVLVGLVLPVATLGNLLQDRAPWLAVTSPRRRAVWRALWLVTLVVSALSVGLLLAIALPPQISTGIIIADILALFALALGGAVILGGPLAWLPPAVVALACSLPGLVPLRGNWLVTADRAWHVGAIGAGAVVVFGALFVMIDEYGISRYHRVHARVPGVTDP